MGGGIQDAFEGIERAWGGEESMVVDVQEWVEVVAKGADNQGSGMTSSVPRSEPFGVDGSELMDPVASRVRNALSSILD
jgi:hypothetical protein